MAVVYTSFTQYSFLVQFLITFVVTLYLYTKYKNDWLNFEKFFFLFFVLITLSNFIAIFFITQSGIPYALVVVFSNSSLVILLIAGMELMGVRNIFLKYVILAIIFLIDTIVNLLYAIQFTGLSEVTFRIITGTDILIFTIPSVIIYVYLTLKTKDISIGFFVLALLLYLAGGFSLTSLKEQGMAVFYISAVICFVIATVLPIVRNRLQNYSPNKASA